MKFKSGGVLVRRSDNCYHVIKRIANITTQGYTIEAYVLENVRTGELVVENGEKLFDGFRKLDPEIGDCNCCGHNNKGCSHADIDGKCPGGQYTFEYVDNSDERAVLSKILKELTLFDGEETDETNVSNRVSDLISKFKNVNGILKNLIMTDIEQSDDIGDVIKRYHQKLS